MLTSLKRPRCGPSSYELPRKDAGPDGLLGLDAIAEVYWQLHVQPRSAWTQELDLRPYKEPF